MQAKQMTASLQQLAPLLEQQGDSLGAQVLLRLADALSTADQQSLTVTLKKVEKNLGHLSNEVCASRASALVDRMSKVALASGAAALSKDFAAVVGLLISLSGLQGQMIFEKVSSALLVPAKPPVNRKPSEVDVRAAADRLTSEAADNERFDALVRELSKLPKPALAAIADRFLGYSRAYKTKAEVLKAIQSRQLQDAIEMSRERRISRIAV